MSRDDQFLEQFSDYLEVNGKTETTKFIREQMLKKRFSLSEKLKRIIREILS